MTAKEQYQQTFRNCLDRMWAITEAKNNDYATESDPFRNFREFGELGFLVRMSDKFARLRTALHEKRELSVSDETIDDTLIDLANYSVLLICWRRANAGNFGYQETCPYPVKLQTPKVSSGSVIYSEPDLDKCNHCNGYHNGACHNMHYVDPDPIALDDIPF